jgi:uncharacterized membrane protein
VAVEANTDVSGPYLNTGMPRYLEAGEKFVFKWNHSAATSFEWSFTVRDIIDGELCTQAAEIDQTGDIVSVQNLSDIYYSYTPDASTVVEIKDADKSHALIVTEGCNYSRYYRKSDGVMCFEAQAGIEYKFNWSNSDNTSFTWNLTERAAAEGESAATAKVISAAGDIDFMGEDKGLVRSYYSYTALAEEKLTIPEFEWFMIWDAATGDTLVDTYYAITEFMASKGKEYILVIEKGYSTATTWEFKTENMSMRQLKFLVTANTRAVQDAEISINGQELTTDSEGYASIELEDDSYQFTVNATACNEFSGTVDLNGLDRLYHISLLNGKSSYRSTHFSISYKGQAVEGAKLNIGIYEYQTDKSGTIKLDLTVGEHEFSVEKEGYAVFTGTADVKSDQNIVEIPVALKVEGEDQYSVNFSITDGTNAVEGASIKIGETTLSSNASGQATVDLTDGTYTYTVNANGFKEYSGNFTVQGANQNISVSLTEEGATTYTLSFTVTENSTAVENASIEINGTTLTTDSEGKASIELESNTYDYKVSATGFDDYTNQVTIDGADKNVGVALTTSGIEEEIAAEFRLYPNPVQAQLYIQTEAKVKAIQVYNLTGLLVKESNLQENSIDLSSLVNGVYIVLIELENQSITKRIIKK